MHRAGTELPYFLSTPAYACLEAVQLAPGPAARFDLALAGAYSVGVTLYELLTGALPVTVTAEEPEATGGSLLDWEAALLWRVRDLQACTHRRCSCFCVHVPG